MRTITGPQLWVHRPRVSAPPVVRVRARPPAHGFAASTATLHDVHHAGLPFAIAILVVLLVVAAAMALSRVGPTITDAPFPLSSPQLAPVPPLAS